MAALRGGMIRELRTSAAVPEAMLELGRRVGERLRPGDVVLLFGPLGAGKTTFVKGLARGLGVDAEVSSPSFALIHQYRGRVSLYHVDLYRLDSPDEVEMLGLEECIESDAVTAVEWPEIGVDVFPEDRLEVRLDLQADGECRSVVLRGVGRRMSEVVAELSDAGTCV